MFRSTYIHIVILGLLVLGYSRMAVCQTLVNIDAIKGIKIYNEALINTPNLESSPAFMGDKIAFVYTDVKGTLFDKEIGEPFFNLAYAQVDVNNTLLNRSPYNKRINSDLHEGPAAYDAHQNRMFFTRSHKEKRLYRGVETDTFFLRIMTADLNPAKPDVKPVNINVANYSVCHPALSEDGKTMVFSSNKPNGNGGMDLYFAYFDGEEWTGIINAGVDINSNKNEVFPFILNDSILIYASDRPQGMGGLDLYVSNLKNGVWQKPEALPEPFNSQFDDLGMIVRENSKSGYFTSNRPGGKGKDDIYRFESAQPIFGTDIRDIVTSTIQVLDKLTLEPLANAAITLTPLDIDVNNFTLSSYNVDLLSGKDPGDLILKLSPKKGQKFPEFYTAENGKAAFQIKKSQKYLISTKTPGFAPLELIFDYQVFGPEFNIVLEPEDIAVEDITNNIDDKSIIDENQSVGTTLDSILTDSKAGDVVVFENIYYNYNSSQLQKVAMDELDALARTMTARPQLKIRLEAHTDSRGTSQYNLQLSIDRANAVRNYLTTQGIDEERINIRGFGESKIRNKCGDHVPCTEAQHSYNRRTEVVIEEN